MTRENEKIKPTLKAYHLLILGCLLSPILILNSNYVNKKRASIKLYEEKSKLFNKIILGRHLEGGSEAEEELQGSDKVCKKGSEDLVDYYKTGDLSKIGLDDKPITAEDKDEPYLKALINIIKTMMNGEDKNDSDEGTQENGAGGRLRNLQLDSLGPIQDDAINYAKHLIPIVAFLVITILAIPGWIICCFCCCCNCCCCCCCKKSGCKIPCFIFTNVFYALVVAVCVYGLSQSNSIFKGMASTECSILKFFDQFLDGETKSEPPRWAGITGINTILGGLHTQIANLKNHNDLDDEYNEIPGAEKDFKQEMKEAGEAINNGDKTGHKLDLSSYTGQTSPDNYALDLVKNFGLYTGNINQDYDGGFTENSLLYFWNYEFSQISEPAYEQLTNAKDGFDGILSGNIDPILESLDSGKNTLEELKGSFDGIKSSVADLILENSETIDEYGKLGFKCIFGVLALINIAIAVFMFLLCFFSGKLCINCCCCRCICKCATHLLWNILALLMIITFLVGFLFTLIGQLGSDVMSLISFVVSKDNLRATEGSILVDSMGEQAKGYLDRCIIGDGKIEKQIGLKLDQIDSFDQIYDAENIIVSARESFEEIKREMPVYKEFKKKIKERAELTTIPSFYSIEGLNYKNFDDILDSLNEAIGTKESDPNKKTERWVIGSTSDKTCDVAVAENNEFNPLTCKPNDRAWISSADNEIKNKALLVNTLINYVEAQKEPEDEDAITHSSNTFALLLNKCRDKYDAFLTQYIRTLTTFEEAIQGITGQLREFTGNNNGLFSFIKCNFIGTNLKIMLKYLKSALGGDVKTVGICLLVVGCSLALSISATILMIVIINVDIENNKKKTELKPRIVEYKN